METTLQPILEAHLELIRTWRSSPEVAQYMFTDNQITSEEQKAWYKKIKNDTSSVYWIIQYGNRPVGVANLAGINPILDSCYWGFYLGDTSIKGVGIGARVEFMVIDYVFNTLKLNKLRGEVFAFNEKVLAMHEKFGFKREAYYREHCKKNGVYHDVVGIGLLKSEWEQVRDNLRRKIYGE
jgi:UDP-4-amino-4,6-dideoxy-N-acetyl-beta-L-altrosamine N-acetyltransferase